MGTSGVQEGRHYFIMKTLFMGVAGAFSSSTSSQVYNRNVLLYCIMPGQELLEKMAICILLLLIIDAISAAPLIVDNKRNIDHPYIIP